MKLTTKITTVAIALLIGSSGVAANAAQMTSSNGGVLAQSWGTNTRTYVKDLASDGFSVRADYQRVGQYCETLARVRYQAEPA